VKHLQLFIITGRSGSGKTSALRAFEDAGFYCVDNMPVALLPKFLELPTAIEPGIAGLAFVMDLREKVFVRSSPQVFDTLREKGYRFTILFLDAEENILVQRYKETRRQHPLHEEGGGGTLVDSIREEKEQLASLKAAADEQIDTTQFNVHRLRSIILDMIQESARTLPMRLHIRSFGYKHGIPKDADLIIDVRFLPNPYFDPDLKPLTGLDKPVERFIFDHGVTREFLRRYTDLLDYLIPLYEKEGKSYLTIAVGCTGGRHRSVAVANAVYNHIRSPGIPIEITHRDIGK
jgi:UPF0042 nucleotide-binding protein